jgi:hypothetical protein
MPELNAQQLALRSAYQRLFNSPDAKLPMEDLYYRFNDSARKNPHKFTDMNVLFSFNAGGRDVLLYIESMMRERNATTE